MHEMSIARSLFKLLNEAASKKKAKSITNISVNVGRFAGVETELLQRAFEVLVQGTIAENSELQITIIDFTLLCKTCGKKTIKDEIDMSCPVCLHTNTTVVSGQEIFLTDFEITV